MSKSSFSGKTKADLVAIARISGILSTTKSQKMTKAELLAYLEEYERTHTSVEEIKAKEETKAVVESEPAEKKPAQRVKRTAKKLEEAAENPEKEMEKSQICLDEVKVKEAEAPKEEAKWQELEAAPAEGKRSWKQNNYRRTTARKGEETRSRYVRHKMLRPEGDAANVPPAENKELRDEKAETAPVEEQGAKLEQTMHSGVLEIMPEGYGFLRSENYIQSPNDLYLPPQYIRKFNLRAGDLITGPARQKRDNDRYQALYYIKDVNGMSPDKMIRRPHFDRLTPVYPNERFVLETVRNELSTRIIDLVAPIGKGQRGMIVSPPKAGKTILLQKIANAISMNNPEAKLIVLLIDERPEEVTDMQRSIKGEVVFSTFDKTPENHVKITELVLERAERMVELGEDVVILLDSITRMGRAYNLTINPTGRTLSGGLDPGALYGPKRFFGAARNIENGGSLTIIATALIETGSRMDEVIFEEFKGTGNMEVYLDRKLSEKRIFPAIDITRSGTRREELLLSRAELDAVWGIRKAFGSLDTAAVTETIISLLLKTSSNNQFISSINVSLNDKNLYDAMRGSLPSSSKNGNGNGASAS